MSSPFTSRKGFYGSPVADAQATAYPAKFTAGKYAKITEINPVQKYPFTTPRVTACIDGFITIMQGDNAARLTIITEYGRQHAILTQSCAYEKINKLPGTEFKLIPFDDQVWGDE